MRAGSHALSLLAVSLNVAVLEVLTEGPRSLVDLRRAVGSPPQTTMRGHLRALTRAGILEKRRRNDFPGPVDFELAGPGQELLAVADSVNAWLAERPEGSVRIGTVAAKSAIKSLVEGWDTSMLRALAARPLTLTELDSVITAVSYPSLERRLGAMRLAGQVEGMAGNGRGTPYAVTEWLRYGVGPLTAAISWERRHAAAVAAPLGRLEVEAGLLLALPLVNLPPDLSGSCRLLVDLGGNGESLAGVLVHAEEGRIVSCATRIQGDAAAWASGSTAGWLHMVIENDPAQLELGGDSRLACAFLDGLHAALFGRARAESQSWS